MVFKTACAVCQAKCGQGGNIGPQLDGIGGRTLLGLQRRVVGQSIVFADLAGKEITVPKADIVRRTQTNQSLIPAALLAK